MSTMEGWGPGAEPGGGVSATLQELARDAAHLDEDFLAERLERAAERWLAAGWSPTLRELVDRVPLLRSRPLALDVAIDAALQGYLRQDLTLSQAADRLRAEMPDLLEAIETHLALRSLMESTRGGAPAPAQECLPAPFGPMVSAGRQRYELVELVGSGSEGVVFRAFDRLLSADGRPTAVAIKRPHVGVSSGVTLEEAARATRVRHPNIAALLGCGHASGGVYLVYEFIDGQSLERWRQRHEPVSPVWAAERVRSLALAVQVAHNAGVVHRDIKPNNILVSASGAAHLTDFGMAQAIRPFSASAPGGSLAFAAPEQIGAGTGSADAPVDVYALGGVLFWLLTGRYPNGSNAEEIRGRARDGTPVVDRSLLHRPGRLGTLYRICARALAADPAMRYASAGALADDLGRWLTFEPVLPFDASPVRRLALGVRRAPGVAAAFAGALVVLVGAVWLTQQARADHQGEVHKLESRLLQMQIDQQQTTIDQQQRRIKLAGEMAAGFNKIFETTTAGAVDASWVPALTVLDEMTDDDLLAVRDAGGDLLAARIRIVERMLDEASAKGTRDTIEMAMWETAHGLWLLESGRNPLARSVMEQNLARSERIFPAGDPWLLNVRCLREIAVLLTEPGGERAAAGADWLNEHMLDFPEGLQLRARVVLSEARTASGVSAASPTPAPPPPG